MLTVFYYFDFLFVIFYKSQIQRNLRKLLEETWKKTYVCVSEALTLLQMLVDNFQKYFCIYFCELKLCNNNDDSVFLFHTQDCFITLLKLEVVLERLQMLVKRNVWACV